MLVVLAVTLPASGGFGPNVPVGWPNRLMILAYCAWLVIACTRPRCARAWTHPAFSSLIRSLHRGAAQAARRSVRRHPSRILFGWPLVC